MAKNTPLTEEQLLSRVHPDKTLIEKVTMYGKLTRYILECKSCLKRTTQAANALGKGCKQCSKKTKTFISEADISARLLKKGLKFLSISESRETSYSCLECNTQFKAKNFYNIKGCSSCSKTAKLTDEAIKKRLHSRLEFLERLASPYIKVKCLDCKSELRRKTNTLGEDCNSCLVRTSPNPIREFTEEEKARMLKNSFQYLGYDRIKQKHSGSCTKCERVLYRGTYDIFERPVCCATFFKSKDEKEIREYVESLGFKADTKRIDGREFDIFVKDKNFAIEYNGLYWHSEDFLNDKGYNGKLYHRDKFNRSLEEGFDLFTLFEHSWKEKPDQVKAFIRSKLGIFTQTIYARKTTVKNIDKNIANDFLDRNHLQGRTNIDKAYGLYYGEDLIGVMSFGRHHRDPNYKGIILNRLAFERDIRVVGGASKLLSFAKEGLKSEGTREILTWSDNNYSKGKVYASLGFTRSKDLPPTYFYFKNGKAYSSQSLKKTKEEKGLGSEKELRAKQGYRRIYNCGKVQWRMKIDG